MHKMAQRRQAIIWTNDGYFTEAFIYAPLGFNELNMYHNIWVQEICNTPNDYICRNKRTNLILERHHHLLYRCV